VAGEQVIYVIKRLPKGVIGDGRSTVLELVEAANASLAALPPWRRGKEYPLDDLALECLAKGGADPLSVPAEGERVNLRPHATTEWGGNTENLTERIHPDNAGLAIEAARMLGLATAGVDLMTSDISRPWHETGAVILEVNYMPQIYLWGRKEQAAALFPAWMEGDGRIPVHLVTGEGDLLAAARALKLQLGQQGRRAHLTGAGYSEDADGREVVMSLSTLFDRSLALVMRRDVDELILAGGLAEIFTKGLAVDRFESVRIVDDDAERRERTAREVKSRIVARTVQASDSAPSLEGGTGEPIRAEARRSGSATPHVGPGNSRRRRRSARRSGRRSN
jgi:cyanophycin synthetase